MTSPKVMWEVDDSNYHHTKCHYLPTVT